MNLFDPIVEAYLHKHSGTCPSFQLKRAQMDVLETELAYTNAIFYIFIFMHG